ncbi:MAG: O-antigen ligase family protein [Victivallaceae bacterium]
MITKLCRHFKLSPLAAKLNIIVAVLSIYYIYLCDSKGVWVALFVALLLFYCVQGRNRLLRRMLLWGVIAVLAGTLIFLYLGGSSQAGAFMMRDVRMQLWSGTLALIRDNLFLGVGQPLFESAYASYNPVEYYLSFFATDRNPDPHNHLLLFLASNGIVAFVAWLILLFLPFGKLFLNLKWAGNLRMKLYFFTALFLFFHGLLDMTLVVWPMNIVFLMMAGIFWGRYWTVPAGMEKSVSVPKMVRWAALLCFAVLISALAVQLCRDVFSSYYFRKTRIDMDLKVAGEALADCDKSIRIKPTPEKIYQAALLAFYDLKNPVLCCSYLNQLEKLTAFKNYVNNNGLMAKALYLQGRKQESLQYFRQEAKNFPISSVNWYFYSVTLKELRLEDEAKQAYDKLVWSLEIKGLRHEHIPLLIKNPRWDMHFREVPGVNIKD